MEYILENEYLTVRFNSIGGELSSIKDKNGTEYLWQGNKKYWSGRAPVLFPICGSIRGDKAHTRDGKQINLPRHGMVRKREFELVEHCDNDIIFEIQSNDEMLAIYPYPFKLAIHYQLYEKAIHVEFIVTNASKTDQMPFQIGAHPGFNCPLFEDEDYDDYIIKFEQMENCSVPEPVTETGLINISNRTDFLDNQTELKLSHDMFHKDAVIFDDIKSHSVTLCSKKHNMQVKIELGDFPYLILWSSSNNGPFLAIEPWGGLSTCDDESDIFEEKRGIQFLNAGESKKYTYSIKLS